MRSRSTSDQLELEIEAEPQGVDSYLVYSDWLQENGDPRGQLIALQHSDGNRASEYLDNHRHEILGLLDEDYHFLDDIQWHMGFLADVTVHVDDGHPATTASAVLRSLLTSPSARFIQRLRVRHPFRDDAVPNVLGAHNLTSLRALDIAPSGELARRLMDLAPLWPKTPNLRALRVDASRVELGRLALPHLLGLELALDALPQIAPITNTLRQLESLGIELADGAPSLDGILDIPFEKLKRFAFHAHTESLLLAVLPALMKMPFCRTLERLEIGDVTVRATAFLTENMDAFAHLERLSVRVCASAVPWDPDATWHEPTQELEEGLLEPLKDFLGERLEVRLPPLVDIIY